MNTDYTSPYTYDTAEGLITLLTPEQRIYNDALMRLEWILDDSAKFGVQPEDDFWVKVCASSHAAKPRLTVHGATEEMMNGKMTFIEVKKGEGKNAPRKTIGLAQFDDHNQMIGLKLYDCVGNVLFCHGTLESSFDVEEDTWGKLMMDFDVLGDLVPPPFHG